MGVTTFGWGPRVQREANKCWFYSLVASILLSLVQLLLLNFKTAERSDKTDEKETSRPQGKASSAGNPVPQNAMSAICIQLVIDCCDLLLPGAAVGWTPDLLASPLVVGVGSTISTTVSGSQIWKRVQRDTR